MPRYHFNLVDARLDREGQDLPDLNAARNTAITLAGQQLQENPAAFWEAQDWYLEVTDGCGLTLFGLMVSAFDAPVTRA